MILRTVIHQHLDYTSLKSAACLCLTVIICPVMRLLLLLLLIRLDCLLNNLFPQFAREKLLYQTN